MRQLQATILLLLAALLLTGCGTDANRPEPEPAEPAAEETSLQQESASTPDPEQEERNRRLKEAQDGFLWEDGYLYAIDEEGNLLRDDWVGVLYFDDNGRYTSGDEKLDDLVAEVIRRETDSGMRHKKKLRTLYEYTRDNIKYVGFANHDLSGKPAHGPEGWMAECAVKALEEGVGNCYHFAATFTALARGLGYQAYATAGIVGSMDDPHAWVKIVDDDGAVWFCDPEIEYRKLLWEKKSPDLFYRSWEEIETDTGLNYRQAVDPFEAERRENTD